MVLLLRLRHPDAVQDPVVDGAALIIPQPAREIVLKEEQVFLVLMSVMKSTSPPASSEKWCPGKQKREEPAAA
jgi:hypothetical protein